MRTFAELLTEYMARTGISDSELARTLGVRRQTVFRWKEGVVARPRHREDVLRCARRLRLTPDERDALLLAAGFPPESSLSQVVTAASPNPSFVPPVQTAKAAPEQVSGKRVTLPVRLAGPWLWAACALLALLAAAGGLLYISTRPEASVVYPTASPGETLIVVGPFASSPQQRTDDSAAGRLQAALRREIEGARLAGVRVEAWPEEVRDFATADVARQRARASVVLGGAYRDGRIMTVSSLAHASAGADKPPLDALVETPDLSMSIQSASPDELRLLALLTLGRLHLDREELGQARVTLTQALAYLETEPSNMAILYSYMAYVSQAERPARLDQAIQYYSEAIDMATDAPIAYLNRGVAYIRQNRPQQWQQDFERVLALRPGHVAAHQALCWAYALDMRPELALPHCDAALAQDSSEGSREGRGVVYAQLGRFSEAIADLQSTLDWLEQRPQSLRARYGPVRAKWVEELKAGRNPFDQAALEELRQE